MLPFDVEFLAHLLVRDTDASLTCAIQQYEVNGFAYVFEVGQRQPCFYLAINTGANPADPSTGEWTYPSGSFIGSAMSDEWHSHYALLDEYMLNDDDVETHLHEVHEFFRSMMKKVRSHWIKQLPQCVFTVNECNDANDVVLATYKEINERGLL